MTQQESMSDCAEFYRLRDRRTIEYLGRPIPNEAPVHVEIDATSAATAAGQLALLALANQLARMHRQMSFRVPDPNVGVLVRTPFAGASLGDVLIRTVTSIDPCGTFVLGTQSPGRCVSIGLGADVTPGLDWYIGADRAVAFLKRSPVGFTSPVGTLRGAGLAACLGCAAVLRTQLGRETSTRELSAWNYAEGKAAEFGPELLVPLDIGRVLMVGGGAVGAALGYWLYVFKADGWQWAVVDGDQVELHNTNRGLAFTARDAGWPEGVAANKAELVASLISSSTPHPRWYHECPELHSEQFDVVLALANDHGVREQLTQLNAVVALQATTGENWMSQLHRHIAGRDGCIWCRTGELRTASFGCSTGAVEHRDGTRSDAALPFLSAASGLMLTTALEKLALGELAEGECNCWTWDFDSSHIMAARPNARKCQDGCALTFPVSVRRQLNAGTKWAGLDP